MWSQGVHIIMLGNLSNLTLIKIVKIQKQTSLFKGSVVLSKI